MRDTAQVLPENFRDQKVSGQGIAMVTGGVPIKQWSPTGSLGMSTRRPTQGSSGID